MSTRYTRADRGITRGRHGWRVVVSLSPDPVTGRRRQVERHRRTLDEAREVLAELLVEHAGEVRERIPGRSRAATRPQLVPAGHRGARYTLAPVLAKLSASELARRLDTHVTTVRRWNTAGGVDEYTADLIAVAVLGVHPSELWPEWLESTAETACRRCR